MKKLIEEYGLIVVFIVLLTVMAAFWYALLGGKIFTSESNTAQTMVDKTGGIVTIETEEDNNLSTVCSASSINKIARSVFFPKTVLFCKEQTDRKVQSYVDFYDFCVSEGFKEPQNMTAEENIATIEKYKEQYRQGAIDVSEAGDGGVIAWMDNETLKISTTREGTKVVLPTDCTEMFSECSSIENIDMSMTDSSKIKSMSIMFFNCESLKEVNLSGIDTSNVTDMFKMFQGCSSLTQLDLTSFDTSNLKNFTQMFYGDSDLEKILVSNKWQIEQTTEWNGSLSDGTGICIFQGCTKLPNGAEASAAYDSWKYAVPTTSGGCLTLVQ